MGASTGVNADGVTYHYVAWKVVAGRMAVGQYTGNGGATQSIATVGFQPKYVIVKADDTLTPVHRPESLVGDWTLYFVGLGKVGDGIQALQTNGFRVGGIAEVNQNTPVYHGMAFGGGLRPPGAVHRGGGIPTRSLRTLRRQARRQETSSTALLVTRSGVRSPRRRRRWT